MDKYHETHPPSELKSVVMGREGSRKNSEKAPVFSEKPAREMSDTPETDEFAKSSYPQIADLISLVKKLERERDEARREAEMARDPKRGRPTGTTKDDSKQGVVRFRCNMREKSKWVKLAQRECKTLSQWIIERLNS